MKLKAYAKINLALLVKGRRANGYHDLDMINQQVDLHDVIEINRIDGALRLSSNDKNLPLDDKNDVYRAAQIMRQSFGIKHGYEIRIEKRIPLAAGLGGGSADAAATINAILELENLKPDRKQIETLALRVSTEVVFLVQDKPARLSGLGEVLKPLDFSLPWTFVIVNPNFEMSTKIVYDSLEEGDYTKDNFNDKLEEELLRGRYNESIKYMHNTLEKISTKLCPDILKIKSMLMEHGSIKAQMSGSGSSVFGIFEDADTAKMAADKLKMQGYRTFIAKAI